MSLTVNLRLLEAGPLQLRGQTAPKALDLETGDEIVHPEEISYDLDARKMEGGLLVEGELKVSLRCVCVRCLKPFQTRLELPGWVCHVPLEGEDRALILHDTVDLTPFVREDILLELPQHPLCQEGCRGLPKGPSGKPGRPEPKGCGDRPPSPWSELNKLKFEK